MKRYDFTVNISNIYFLLPDIVFYRVCISPFMDWHNKVYSNYFNSSKTKILLEIPKNIQKGLIIIEYYDKNGVFYTSISKNTILFQEQIDFKNIEFETSLYNNEFSITACEYPWLNPVINSSGETTICCNDPFFEQSIGNIKDCDFKKIWFNNEKIKKIRYSHIIGDLSDVNICQRCIGKKSENASFDIIEEYSDSIKEIKGLFNYYKARLSNKLIFEYLFLELTDKCNIKCNFCNQKYSDWEKVHGIKEKGFMDIHNIENFINKFKDFVFFNNINLFWLGEPLLNKNINSVFSILSDNRDFFSNCELHTNGILINEDFLNSVKNIKFPLKIHISCDAFNEKTYNNLKSAYNIENTFENIKNLIDYSKENNNITIVLQYILCKQNKNELNDFINYWEFYFKSLKLDYQITTYFDFIKKYIIYIRYCDSLNNNEEDENKNIFEFARKSIKHTNVNFIDYKSVHKGIKPDFCTDPFEFLVIRYDGFITHCCHDTAMKNSDFNIFDNSYLDFKINLQKFIKDFIEGNKQICKNCNMYKSENTHKITLKKIIVFMRKIEGDCFLLLRKVLKPKNED
ncbi:MAG: radical SAM protein [Candidatus Muirbacterium halophilum]|nr:radical SAM protein [Candidatus Muirbacterium halophilum]MCK9476436.1 radical SAM protein [Candidatus Muirbacterium halophilum]